MSQENKNLLYAITFFFGCLGALQFGEPDGTWQFIWFIVWLLLAFPILLLRLFEAGSVWRQSNHWFGRLIGWFFGLFHLLFALLTFSIGVAIILWILYNLLIEQHPEFMGSLGGFGIAPIMIVLGWFWLRGIFDKPLPELSEWFFIEFDDNTVFVQANPPNQDAWQYQFLWAEICRVCFEDGGLEQSDCLYVWIAGQEESFVLPTEAKGGSEFFVELNRRGLFPDELMKQASCSTDGGLYCYPSLEQK
ncbi:hypothetical protein [Wielerella bovis]|uniref:hypothetical protein n=1 Tax=Wielerella bovis TaxID=2917790 RepID=UPI0020187BDE|nr:hypothetical protein [Wielerella bovis]MCG7657544.1 hypothetical protein [Wielerella bovis]MCG7659765.1 hypothetical protein [Wielerella bovis]